MIALLASLALLPALARGAPLVLNEYNAVDDAAFLRGGDATTDADGGTAADPFFGRIAGNGGDWFELVVTAENLDIRGWSVELSVGGGPPVVLTFSNDLLWSQLRAGTLITVAESVPEDPSYDPDNGDWWIHVQAGSGGSGTYISAVDFAVSDDDWQITIRDDLAAPVFGPAGEGIAPATGVTADGVVVLATDPSAAVTAASPDYAFGYDSSFGAANRFADGSLAQSLVPLQQDLPLPDRDGDGIADDGDRSGTIGDAPCLGGAAAGCDDNCLYQPNPLQEDPDGVAGGGPDGVGTACQCGDLDSDGNVGASDVGVLQAHFADLSGSPLPPGVVERCPVKAPEALCDLVALTVLRRNVEPALPMPPAPAQVCPVALSLLGNAPPAITSTPVNGAVDGLAYTYDVDADDPDLDVPTFSLETAPTGMSVDGASGVISWTPDTAQLGSHLVTVVASDPAGLHDRQSFVVEVYPASEIPVHRVNCGGPAYVDTQGISWSADYGYNTGSVWTESAAAIAGTPDPTIYRTQRFDGTTVAPPLIYSLPVSNGNYRVRMHFATLWSGTNDPGERVYDVSLEGVLVLDDFDPVAVAGWRTAHVETFDVAVTDGSVDISFDHVVQNPEINAIEVLELAAPATVVASPALIEWGHVEPNTAGPTETITLDNTSPVPAVVDTLTFELQQGVGHDFHVTLGGNSYAGDHATVAHAVSLVIPPNSSVDVPVDFLPTEESDNLVNLVFSGNFPDASVVLSGTGGQSTGDPFLHVVINAPALLVDYDGDGFEDVDLVGSFSHTHEFGRVLVLHEWKEDGVLFSTSPDLTRSFATGSHTVTLTITDDNVPPRTLTDSFTFVVAPPTAVPGVLVQSYVPSGQTPTDLLTALPATPDHAAQQSSFGLAQSPLGAGVMIQMLATVDLPASDTYTFQQTGGAARRLLVDGGDVVGPVALAAGPHVVDARFALDSLGELPLDLQLAQGAGPVQPIDPTTITHDLSGAGPIINSLAPNTGSELGGNLVILQGLGFFLPSEVTVHWGATPLSGPALSSVTPEEIRLNTPAGVGIVDVSVETPRGTSNSFSFSYDPGGPLPINFSLRDLQTGIGNPTSVAFGPDERLYVANQYGYIWALTLDDDYNVTASEQFGVINGLTNKNILGIAFNPFDPPDPVRLYVSHSQLFANGGSCFTGFSPYSGQVSVLEGPNFDTVMPLITGAPVSNHDHAVNGIAFDNNGDAYVQMGGNTNAGVPACPMGDLPESPLSAAVVKAEISRPGFNGAITYNEIVGGAPNDDQVYGDIVELAPGIDVYPYGMGFRNGYDLVFTTKERIYSTDNGPNGSYGAASTGPTTETSGPTTDDSLDLVEFGRYYGHPNRNRGLDDPRQNVFHDLNDPSTVAGFTQALTSFTSSTNGIAEYRANNFNGAMRGDLLTQRLGGVTYRVTLSPDGRSVANQTTLPVSLGSLDITTAPGGVLIGGDHGNSKIVIAEPSEPGGGLKVFDIFPWRAPATGGHPFVIAGEGFGNLGDTSVSFDGTDAVLTSVTPTRIRGVVPAEPLATEYLIDVVVTVAGQAVALTEGFRYLGPAGGEPWGFGRGPDLPTNLGEVAAGEIGGVLYVVGQGTNATLAYDLASETWAPVGSLAQRPYPGHHHAAVVSAGKLYLFGGLGDGSEGKVQIYDPVADSWSEGTPMPWAAGSSLSALIGGVVHVCGGIVGGSTVTTCGTYDPGSDTWSAMASMTDGRNHAAAATDGTRLFVFGGRGPGSGDANVVANGFADVQIYDPGSDSWESSNDPGSTLVPLPQARGGTGVAVYFDTEFYVFGGETLNGAGAGPNDTYDRVDIYDPVANTWRVGPPMPVAMHGIWPVLIDNAIYLPGGGDTAAYSISNNFLIFGP